MPQKKRCIEWFYSFFSAIISLYSQLNFDVKMAKNNGKKGAVQNGGQGGASQSVTNGSNNYTAKDIYVLEGLEPVRKRPGMYIGSTGIDGLHHLIWEVFDNSLDEAMAGYAKNILVTLLPKNNVRVVDDGRGIPVETHKQTKKSALETVMTTLHAGGKFGGDSYKVSGGLHGVGVSVVNALSILLTAEVCRDGERWSQSYERGKPISKVKKIGSCKGSGTAVTFEPDTEIFKETRFNWDTILEHLRQQAYLTAGVKIQIKDERDKEEALHASYTFCFESGIRSYVKFLNKAHKVKNDAIFYTSKEVSDISIEIALQYIDDLTVRELAFANNIYNPEGGSHLTGFRTALTRVLNDYARKNGYLKEKDSLTGEDVREGLTAVIAVKIRNAVLQFEGQTKAKLGNPEARGAVESVFGEAFSNYLEENPSEARAILEKVILALEARKAAKAAKDTVLRKGALDGLTLPGKLADCQSRKAEDSELFLVEGDSAGGCFSGDTKIALTDGRNISFKELVEEHNRGIKHYCYSINEQGSVGIKEIINPRITKRNAAVIKVILDNGEEITSTPDHKFMMVDGSFKEAENLTPQDSLMPLYRQYSRIGKRITIDGYELVFDPNEKRWVFTHFLADRFNLKSGFYTETEGPHRHHKDFNKLNNNPDNIERVTKDEHLEIYRRLAKRTLLRPDVLEKLRKLRQTPEYKNKIREKMLSPAMRKLLSERAKKQWANGEYKKYMTERFLAFYRSNEAYRKQNSERLNALQKKYWSDSFNRAAQSKRVSEFFRENPEKRQELSNFAINQWSDNELLEWRRSKTKEQWTPEFRIKRLISYNKTYRERALKVLRSIFDSEKNINAARYEEIRKKSHDKCLIKYETILKRFFGNNTQELETAVKNYNHKIKRLQILDEKIDVYDLEVPGTHNFALASGVFVHNSAKQARDRKFQAILPLRGKILNVEKARLDKMLSSKEIRALIIALGAAIGDELDISKLRYHKVVIMTDADVDGAHIRTLLLTLFYRYYLPLIESGYLYIAQPPLFRIQKGKDVRYVYSEEEKEKNMKELEKIAKEKDAAKGKKAAAVKEEKEEEEVPEENIEGADESAGESKIKGVSVQRYKGLGEMNPSQLWETTMDPAVRVLRQVTIADAAEASKTFDMLMGDEVAPRKLFIQTHARNVQNIDV